MRLFVDLDARATSDLIVSHPDALPLTTIVEHLRVDSPRVLLQVLDAFFTAHTSKFNALAESAVHDQLLQLYLRFDEEKVLTFLKRSTRYTVSSAQAALAFASSVAGASATLKRALVHVLVRLNQHSRAVSILVDELHDTASAIDVAVALDDADVWVDVLTRCAKSSDGEVVGSIFDRVGTTPQFERRLISMLPPSLHIPRLAQRLQLVIRDKHLLLRMTQTCAELCKQDTTTLFSSFVSAATSGMAMPRSTACTFCSGPLCEPARTSGGALPGSEGSAGAARDAAAGVGVGNLANLAPFEDGADVVAAASGAASSACVSAHDAVVFFCRHAYHATCIQMYAANLQAARLALRRSRPRSDSSASSDWSRRRSGSVTGAASRRRLGGSGSGTPRSASTRRLRRASYGSSSVASDSGSSWNAEDTAADRPHALRCPMCSASDAA
ncbi:MAG: hypothetical protein EOO65_00605 [Methanosarcinales archaeon]|nr:MAG: hypothetical protein EOO65_00605 [Methanosarcinales archaeon]